MHSLFVISILISLVIGVRSFKLYRTVADNKTGYEEIIPITILLGACINICIDVTNFLNPSPDLTTMNSSVISRLMECLISYSIIEYMSHMHNVKIKGK